MTRSALSAAAVLVGLFAFTSAARADALERPADRALVAAAFAKPSASRQATPTVAIRYTSAARPGSSPTAIDHQFSPDGVVGSVGYLCGIDKLDPDSYQRGGGPTSTYGHQGTFLGASLGFAFK